MRAAAGQLREALRQRLALFWIRVPFLLAGVGVLSWMAWSAYRPAAAWLLSREGYLLTVDTPEVTVRTDSASSGVVASFPLRNISDETVTVYGAEMACGRCGVASHLPLAIPAHGEAEITLRVPTPCLSGDPETVRTAVIYTDPPGPRLAVSVRVFCEQAGDHLHTGPSAAR
jgi:hypothetical protein